MKKTALLLTILILANTTYAALGFGFHWGGDFTLSMPNAEEEYITFDVSDPASIQQAEDFLKAYVSVIEPSLDSSMTEALVDSLMRTPQAAQGELPLYISRTNFQGTSSNYGGKILIDALPVEFDFSFNFGRWLYDGVIYYPSSFKAAGDIDPSSYHGIFEYSSVELNPQSLGLEEFRFYKTPYLKFHVDISARKTFGSSMVAPYLGLGLSFHWATPVVSQALLFEAIDIDSSASGTIDDILADNMTNVVEYMIEEAKKEARTGMHLQIGINVKPPLFPVRFYGEAKYNILFGDKQLDERGNVGLKGFLFNFGVMVYAGNSEKSSD